MFVVDDFPDGRLLSGDMLEVEMEASAVPPLGEVMDVYLPGINSRRKMVVLGLTAEPEAGGRVRVTLTPQIGSTFGGRMNDREAQCTCSEYDEGPAVCPVHQGEYKAGFLTAKTILSDKYSSPGFLKAETGARQRIAEGRPALGDIDGWGRVWDGKQWGGPAILALPNPSGGTYTVSLSPDQIREGETPRQAWERMSAADAAWAASILGEKAAKEQRRRAVRDFVMRAQPIDPRPTEAELIEVKAALLREQEAARLRAKYVDNDNNRAAERWGDVIRAVRDSAAIDPAATREEIDVVKAEVRRNYGVTGEEIAARVAGRAVDLGVGYQRPRSGARQPAPEVPIVRPAGAKARRFLTDDEV